MVDKMPGAGGLGEIRSKRIPGREDVPEEIKPEPKEDPKASSQLTSHDVELMTALLDACAQRGAFKIDEYGLVSSLYTKLRGLIEEK